MTTGILIFLEKTRSKVSEAEHQVSEQVSFGAKIIRGSLVIHENLYCDIYLNTFENHIPGKWIRRRGLIEWQSPNLTP